MILPEEDGKKTLDSTYLKVEYNKIRNSAEELMHKDVNKIFRKLSKLTENENYFDIGDQYITNNSGSTKELE